MRTRIALATAAIVALEITTAMSLTAGGALVLSGAIPDGAHESTGSATPRTTSVGSAVAGIRALGAETVAQRTRVTAGDVGTPVPPTAGGIGTTSSVPRPASGTDGHVGNDQSPPTSLPRNATTSTSTIPTTTTTTTGSGQTVASTTGSAAEAVATGTSDSDASSTDTADWSCIRNAESGDVYNSPSEPQGAYGILDSTWQSLGYSGSPYEASASEQDAAALELYRQYGWQPWGTRYACGLG
jgi:Transglycosylase-like domain